MFNGRSVVNRQFDLYAMINTSAPDVMVITETFLDLVVKLFLSITQYLDVTEIVMVEVY